MLGYVHIRYICVTYLSGQEILMFCTIFSCSSSLSKVDDSQESKNVGRAEEQKKKKNK